MNFAGNPYLARSSHSVERTVGAGAAGAHGLRGKCLGRRQRRALRRGHHAEIRVNGTERRVSRASPRIMPRRGQEAQERPSSVSGRVTPSAALRARMGVAASYREPRGCRTCRASLGSRSPYASWRSRSPGAAFARRALAAATRGQRTDAQMRRPSTEADQLPGVA